MKISIISLFPEMFVSPFHASIIKRAVQKKLVTIEYINLRDFALDTYKTVDDHSYGGGAGMLLKVDVVDRAIQSVKGIKGVKSYKILLDPQGIPYTQKKARELRTYDHLILVCGRYEGVDERVRDLVDEEISIGDYVVSGGEIPAMVIVDSVIRLIPGVLTKNESTLQESFENALLEYPQYTRPPSYKGVTVPQILLSGNHQKIASWRSRQAERRTHTRRPDLSP